MPGFSVAMVDRDAATFLLVWLKRTINFVLCPAFLYRPLVRFSLIPRRRAKRTTWDNRQFIRYLYVAPSVSGLLYCVRAYTASFSSTIRYNVKENPWCITATRATLNMHKHIRARAHPPLWPFLLSSLTLCAADSAGIANVMFMF